MSYDHRCYQIAAVFLGDEPGYKALPFDQQQKLAAQLAQDVQDAVEEGLSGMRESGRFER